jgi:hypothetical protein
VFKDQNKEESAKWLRSSSWRIEERESEREGVLEAK